MQRGSKCKTEVGGLCCSHHTLTGIWEGWHLKDWLLGVDQTKIRKYKSCMQVHAALIMSNLIQVSPDVTTRLDDRIGRVKPRSMYLENGSVTLILSWQ